MQPTQAAPAPTYTHIVCAPHVVGKVEVNPFPQIRPLYALWEGCGVPWADKCCVQCLDLQHLAAIGTAHTHTLIGYCMHGLTAIQHHLQAVSVGTAAVRHSTGHNIHQPEVCQLHDLIIT